MVLLKILIDNQPINGLPYLIQNNNKFIQLDYLVRITVSGTFRNCKFMWYNLSHIIQMWKLKGESGRACKRMQAVWFSSPCCGYTTKVLRSRTIANTQVTSAGLRNTEVDYSPQVGGFQPFSTLCQVSLWEFR